MLSPALATEGQDPGVETLEFELDFSGGLLKLGKLFNQFFLC